MSDVTYNIELRFNTSVQKDLQLVVYTDAMQDIREMLNSVAWVDGFLEVTDVSGKIWYFAHRVIDKVMITERTP